MSRIGLGQLKRSTSNEVFNMFSRAAIASAATSLESDEASVVRNRRTKTARYNKLQVLKSEYHTTQEQIDVVKDLGAETDTPVVKFDESAD